MFGTRCDMTRNTIVRDAMKVRTKARRARRASRVLSASGGGGVSTRGRIAVQT
jgi:hypothetical protein